MGQLIEDILVNYPLILNNMSRKLTNEELAIALIKLKKEFNQLSERVERMAEYLKVQHIKNLKK